MSMPTHETKSDKQAHKPFDPSSDPSSSEAAFKSLLPKLQALPASEVSPFRASAPQVVANIYRVARSYAEDRSRIAAAFKPEAFNPEAHDDLVSRAQALWHADLAVRRVIDVKGSVGELIAKTEPLRQRLLKAAIYLWENHDELGPQVADIREGRGYLDLADDLVALSGLFQAHWDFAKTRCDIQQADLAQARALSVQIVDALTGKEAAKDVQEREVGRLRDIRDRAAAYAREGVETVRAAAAFVYQKQPEALDRYPAFYFGLGGGRPSSRRASGKVAGGEVLGGEAHPETGPSAAAASRKR